MTLSEVMKELEGYGNASTKKVLMNHGAQEPFFGVKVQDLKKIVKKTKKDHDLSLSLYATGNSDAMYLAGLIADENKITKEDLEDWAEKAYWSYLSEYAVPWVASESAHGLALGLKWIESDQEHIASAGWSTLASYAAVKEDKDIPLDTYRQLLKKVQDEIHHKDNRVRYTMNGFVIAVGSYIEALTNEALEVAAKTGKVSVDMNGTACKVPLAEQYINKIIDKGRVGKKRKNARC